MPRNLQFGDDPVAVELPTAIVNVESNVRDGPGVNFPATFWLANGIVVNVMGRNYDGSWLHIEHDGRKGWIFRPHVNIALDVRTELPDVSPTANDAAPAPLFVDVTGTVVNLRLGPSMDHRTHGQVSDGVSLTVTGRNADGDWLQVVNLSASHERVWIYATLTTLDATGLDSVSVERHLPVGCKRRHTINPTKYDWYRLRTGTSWISTRWRSSTLLIPTRL